MPTLPVCSECGSSISPASPDRLCLRCLIGLALGTPEETRVPGQPPEKESVNPTGRVFGNYELLEHIGQGGMGVVYKARQRTLDRVVALKLNLAGARATEAEIKRFHTEATAAATLQHPNVVSIHEVGEHEGQHYFSMDYIEGSSLAEVIRRTPLPAERSARYVKTIAEAIHYAHGRGVLHRDLKPHNILIDAADEPRITDFGLARRIEVDADPTVSGAVLGTPSYMPPEQAAGKRWEIGPASDIYSLGAILYDLLTGRPPFRAETPLDTLRQVIDTEPAPPRLLNRKIPRDLETICLKCLAKAPGQRYRSAQELAEDLRRFLEREPIQARPVGHLGRLWRWCRRNPLVAGFSGATGSLLLMLAIAAVLFRTDALESNVHTAWHAAEMIRLELVQLRTAVNDVTSKPELAQLIVRNDMNALSTFLEARLREYQTNAPSWLRIQNWVIMTPMGESVVRWPNEGMELLKDRSHRDYFTGARESADRVGIGSVHVSRVYESVEDHYDKFGVSKVIRDAQGTIVGVVTLMLRTVSFAEALGPSTDQRRIVLIGEWDPSAAFSPTTVPPEFVLLFHPAFGTSNLVVPIVHPYLRQLVPLVGPELPEPPASTAIQMLRDPGYRDPVARTHRQFSGRWLAGFVRVPDTPFIVVYQSRDRVTDALVTAALLTALALLGLFGWRFVRSRTHADTGGGSHR